MRNLFKTQSHYTPLKESKEELFPAGTDSFTKEKTVLRRSQMTSTKVTDSTRVSYLGIISVVTISLCREQWRSHVDHNIQFEQWRGIPTLPFHSP